MLVCILFKLYETVDFKIYVKINIMINSESLLNLLRPPVIKSPSGVGTGFG